MDQQQVWALVTENEKLLRREIRRFLPYNRRSREQVDELYSDVVIERCHSIMATYDGRVKPITHLCANVRWYAYKAMNPYAAAHRTKIANAEQIPLDLSTASTHELDAQVSLILEKLSPDHARLIQWKVLEGFDTGEIAAYLGVTGKDVRKMVAEALEAVRSVVSASPTLVRALELVYAEL